MFEGANRTVVTWYIEKIFPYVMEKECKHPSFWTLVEFKVTQCLYQNFLLSGN